MTGQLSGKPVLILPEGTSRYIGRDAMRTNILAARIIAEAVRTTLGPRGMDKMLVDSLGDITITNDGVTILKDIDVEHPAAKMMVEVAKTQDDEVGDGTTTAVVLGGELLKRAEELLDQNIHATVIASGYRQAAEKANEILENMAIDISIDDEETLKKVAMTAMTGKGAESAKDHLAKLVVKAVKHVAEEVDGKYEIDPDDIKVEKKEGGSISDTELIEGIVIDKERVHPRMPKTVKNAKIALINAAIEVKDTETDAEIRITDPTQLKAFLDEEEKMLKDMVDKIKKSGANVVFCQKGIDDMAQHFLAKENIFAVRRVKKSDMEKLAKATGASIVNSLDDLTPEDLGEAGFVEEKKIAGEEMVFVTECKYPKAVTLFIRGGTEHVVDEVERGVNDAIRVVESAIEDKKVVPGGGAPEIEVARGLRDYAESVGGREQLAITAFSDAIDIIPRTLAENAGLDSIDTLVELRSAHEKGGPNLGLDAFTGKPTDMVKEGVLEPLRTKTQGIKSASEAAIMILRIDDVIAASKKETGGGGPPGGPSEETGGEEEF
ncbi:MAG: thermosome subunit alpha [Candidatus Hydrothermarchaeota archaeon]